MSNQSNLSRNRLVQDRGANETIWMPNFRSCFRLLLLARLVSALHSNITDCDETYNYWEPLHLLTNPPSPIGSSQAPFQTWEYSPQYAIRSWAYIAQYVPIAGTLMSLMGKEKSASFYATRFFLAFCSSLSEATLLETVSKVIHPRIARYMLIFLLFSAGMYESSTALLPSSFVMYTTTWAMSFAFQTSREGEDRFSRNLALPFTSTRIRTLAATAIFASGAILAWPFALVLSFPFVFEELFLPSGVIVSSKRYLEFVLLRCTRWIKTVFIAAMLALPIILVDTMAYARLVIVPLNIITYNILSARRGAGPTLYGVEPWYYYLMNLVLNFGPILVLALVSIPAMIFVSLLDSTRITFNSQGQNVKESQSKKKDDGDKAGANSQAMLFSSSAGVLLIFRLLPFYVWLGLLTLQAHKEERFVYPAYPLLCFNAAVGLFCGKNVIEIVLARVTKVQERAADGKMKLSSLLTCTVLAISCAFSLSRSIQTTQSYKAPFEVLKYFTQEELPRVIQANFPNQKDASHNLTKLLDLRSNGDEAIQLCYGKEWHRFPSTYLVPDGVKVDFIKSDFNGILPKHFARGDEVWKEGEGNSKNPLSNVWPWKVFTRPIREGFNDLNLEELDRYVDLSECDYLVDVDFAHRFQKEQQTLSTHEKRFLLDEMNWDPIFCTDFLDASFSHANSDASKLSKIRATIDRAFWLPEFLRGNTNRFGQYCLLKTKRSDSVINRHI